MKVKLEAGASLDLLTKSEVDEVLRSWHNEVRAGVKYPLFSAQAVADANGLVSFTADTLGPAEGFVWDVRRLAVYAPSWDTATDLARIYINEPSPARLVAWNVATQLQFEPHALVLNYGSTLYITGGVMTVGDVFTITGQAKEVPYQLGWSL